MEKIIQVKRTKYNQNSTVTYNETSSNKKLIEKKELIIKSLSAMQLLLTAMTEDNISDLDKIIGSLSIAYNEIEQLLLPDSPKFDEDFYEDYKH